MIKNYIKIALRAFGRSKMHSAINVAGLGLGIACCILILLFVRDEWSFDTFHSKAERIHRVYVKEDWGENQQFFNTSTPFPMGPLLKETFPDIEREVRILKFRPQVKVGENQYTEFVTVGGQSLFDVFDFEVIGSSRKPLQQLDGVVLTRFIAKKYFGEEDPMHKTISIQLGDNFEDFQVEGIVNSIPGSSSINFGILISDLNLTRMYDQNVLTSSWFNVNPETYILLKDGVSPQVVESKFPSLFKTVIGDDYAKSKYTVGLQPLTDIHLNNSYPTAYAPVSNPQYSYILAGIAVLILFVACINFVTLSLARSLQRAREVGIRKVVGAVRRQLIVQFAGEAIIVTLISLLVGLGVAFLCMPLFNDLSGKQLSIRFEGFTLLASFGLVLFIGLLAGSYPAWVLSAYKPIAVLKGKLPLRPGKQSVRTILVGIQLVLSIFLISSTLLMREQLIFLRDRDLGFNKEQVVVVPLQVPRVGRLAERVKVGFSKVDQFKSELKRFPAIAIVTGASHDFANGAWTGVGYTDDNGTYRNFSVNIVDDQYIPTMEIKIKEGRNFISGNEADAKRAILVNEAFVKEYRWTDPVGKRIPGKRFKDHEIIGVVKDFNYASLYTKVDPLVLTMDATIPLSGTENIAIDNSPIPKLMIKVRPGEIQNALTQIKATWEKIMGSEEFSFSFVDQALTAQYRSDQNLGSIISVATVLAILIGSFGLYGLASLAMQHRTREISIRKVMGATRESLLVLLGREYVVLIVVCMIVSVPMTYTMITQWLQSFEYKISIGAFAFLMAGMFSLLIALFAISYHALKTASAQPAETLKQE